MTHAPHRSILVIEDEPLLAMDIEMTLRAAGFHVLGPAKSNADALSVLMADDPDIAILDLNLGMEMVFPVFDYLDSAGKPFLILSGHSRQMVPARYRSRPFLQKPYESSTLLRMVAAALDTARDAAVWREKRPG
jgi:DNA-binding response OmpR family regulator